LKKFLISGLILSISFSSFAQEFTKESVQKLAHDVIKEYNSTLKKELKDAKKLNEKYAPKVSIKRISLNNRNEKAKADESEEKILKAFELIAKSDAYQPDEIVQVIDDNTFKVYSPITMNSRDCKKCHGVEKKVDKKSKDRFFEVYKNNNAYGYKSGDVRGAVVVTIFK
jgi:ABC-type transporter MlaC component